MQPLLMLYVPIFIGAWGYQGFVSMERTTMKWDCQVQGSIATASRLGFGLSLFVRKSASIVSTGSNGHGRSRIVNL
ncbi:hypothetical protein B0T24DRAFT_89386 [Lasiosphaeria ovina]|uniref:Uncharacterized protein n=1 Tax=Lasiosphaeria ovina TaxID=92902 RepID=A0AAE0TYT9_9PEZI|nr:hypothetical protein B0T24DRAFT_89386 [Lasiosphaeria ovina]